MTQALFSRFPLLPAPCGPRHQSHRWPQPLAQPGHSPRIRIPALHCLGALGRLNTKHHARHAAFRSVAQYTASPAQRDPLCRRRLSPCAASAGRRVRRLSSSQLVCRRSRLLGQSGLNKESPDSRGGGKKKHRRRFLRCLRVVSKMSRERERTVWTVWSRIVVHAPRLATLLTCRILDLVVSWLFSPCKCCLVRRLVFRAFVLGCMCHPFRSLEVLSLDLIRA